MTNKQNLETAIEEIRFILFFLSDNPVYIGTFPIPAGDYRITLDIEMRVKRRPTWHAAWRYERVDGQRLSDTEAYAVSELDEFVDGVCSFKANRSKRCVKFTKYDDFGYFAAASWRVWHDVAEALRRYSENPPPPFADAAAWISDLVTASKEERRKKDIERVKRGSR
jgi:hypothetical protein